MWEKPSPMMWGMLYGVKDGSQMGENRWAMLAYFDRCSTRLELLYNELLRKRELGGIASIDYILNRRRR
jgi:hypothetical protein